MFSVEHNYREEDLEKIEKNVESQKIEVIVNYLLPYPRSFGSAPDAY